MEYDMIMEKYYKIGDLFFSIGGEGPFFEALASYFSENQVSKKQTPILRIRVANVGENDSNFAPDYYSLSGSISFNRNTFYIKKGGFSYSVKNLFVLEKSTELVLYPQAYKDNVIRSLKRSLISLYRGRIVGPHNQYEDFVRNVANYSCLWYVFALSFMKKESVFLHCGMMAKDGKGIILTGTSGCGKTSTMLDMITNSGYKFMAEDFGILNSQGILYDMPKKAAIYQSDVKWGNKELVAAVNRLCSREKLEWRLKLKTNPLRYFKPCEIFGEKIEHVAQLEKIFILKRTLQGTEIECHEIGYEQLAERAKTASFREIKELYEILTNIRAVGGDSYYADYPSIYELEQRYLAIILPALKGVKCFEIAVPANVNPSETAKELFRH